MAAMGKLSRREFLGAAIVTAGVTSTSAAVFTHWRSTAPQSSVPGRVIRGSMTPASQVPLGKSGLRVSVVGIGTGSIGWGNHSNQTRLGQSEFTRLMRYAFDHGINFFDLADSYGSHPFFSEAMKGVRRDRY